VQPFGFTGSADWAAAPNSTAPKAPVVRPALAQQSLVILNPFALARMAPQDQEKVRQQINQMGQQIMGQSCSRIHSWTRLERPSGASGCSHGCSGDAAQPPTRNPWKRIILLAFSPQRGVGL